MPNGSYTDGHTKTVAAESISRIFPMGSISRTQNTPVRDAGQLGHRGPHFGGDLRGVGRSGAQHQLHVRAEMVRGRQQVGDALLPGDPPDERHDGPAAVDAEVGQHRPGRRIPAPAGYHTSVSIPLRMTCTRLGSSVGVDPQHVVAHTGADRDHGVGGQSPRSAPPTTTPGSRRRAARPSTAAAAPANARSAHGGCRRATRPDARPSRCTRCGNARRWPPRRHWPSPDRTTTSTAPGWRRAAARRAGRRTRPGAARPCSARRPAHNRRSWATSSVTCTPAPP